MREDRLNEVGDGGVADTLEGFEGSITIEALTNEEAGAPEDKVASG
jgi:hypothetical protein